MKKQSVYYLVGNAHIDTVWQWRWQEGSAEALSTIRSALDRMNEFPDYTFVCSSAVLYRWVEEFAPDMFEEIKSAAYLQKATYKSATAISAKDVLQMATGLYLSAVCMLNLTVIIRPAKALPDRPFTLSVFSRKSLVLPPK